MEGKGILREAVEAKFKPNPIVMVLIFLLVFLVSSILGTIPGLMYVFYASSHEETVAYSPDLFTLLNLFGTVFSTIAAILYCRCIEKRKISSMGFRKKGAVSNFFLGIVIGFVIFSLGVLILYLTNNIEYVSTAYNGHIAILVLMFFAFMVQGMSEEVMLRGFLLVSLSNRIPVLAAVLSNSIIFALLHLANDGITVLAVVNLTLFGIFASMYFLYTGSIWGISAIHGIWNFVQGNFYGIMVSGIEIETSVFKFSPVNSNLMNGGSFGFEGGLVCTFVLSLCIIVLFLLQKRKDKSGKDKLV